MNVIKTTIKIVNDFLTGWRPPNGVMKASNEELDNSEMHCEHFEFVGAVLVIVGLVIEVLIVEAHSLFDPASESRFSLIATILVAIGVIMEVRFGRVGKSYQSELVRRSNERLADAIDRAAALERITAWRKVSLEQRNAIASELKAVIPTLHVFFEYQNGDPEATMFARDIANVFPSITGHVSNSWYGSAIFGASISVAPDIDRLPILKAFSAAGVTLVETGWNPIKMWPILHQDPRPNVLICVYPKPPAEFIFAAKADGKSSNNPAANRE